ncbi:MAG: hypothetical protein WCV70_03895 [Patescibacteria group bacterium]|jgi:hypothetical protein
MNVFFKAKTKRNYYFSYIKGWAIISIMLIHLLDWSGLILSKNIFYFKELLYPSVLFFIATAGGLTFLAYGKYEMLKASKKLFRRGGELIAVYFLYNIIKLYIYNFSAEPFYNQFIAAGKMDLSDILLLQAFTAPISIILTIGIFLMVSPLFLYLSKIKYPKLGIGVLSAAVIYFGYFFPLPSSLITNFLYAKNNIMFPLILWLTPFLICFYLSMLGFEKYKGRLLLIFSALAMISGILQFNDFGSVSFSGQMYPLKLFYVFSSFALMYLLIYIFYFLERLRRPAVNYFLALIRLLGDSTLAIYIYHWIVIDITLWVFYPRINLILLTVPTFLLVYIFLKRQKLLEYFKSYG